MRVDMSDITDRMAELMKPIDQQIMMCDDRDEILMLACAMLQRVREIFDSQLGVDGRRKMFKDLS
jgi:hypothetical protein